MRPSTAISFPNSPCCKIVSAKQDRPAKRLQKLEVLCYRQRRVARHARTEQDMSVSMDEKDRRPRAEIDSGFQVVVYPDGGEGVEGGV